MPSPKRVLELNVYLWAIERTVTLLQTPWLAGSIKSFSQLLLGTVPKLNAAKRLLGPCAERECELKTKYTVDVEDKLESRGDLILDLFFGAKDVRIVLLEPAHSGKASQGAAQFISVENAEVSKPHGQLAIGPLPA